MKNGSFEIGSTKITLKHFLTKVNRARNWALRAAEKLITDFLKTSDTHKNAETKIVWEGE